jgi:DNA-binding MarR family transcriptional regulator
MSKARLISVVEDNPALTAAVLRITSEGGFGMSKLAKELHVGPAKLIKLARALVDEGLVENRRDHARKAGRPLVRIVPTPLGEEYLHAYEALSMKMLKSRPSDLLRAVAEANYARRLVERGLSPTTIFMELNSLVVPLRRPAS